MNRIHNARFNRRRRGAAATELAILLPFLCLLFTAALDFGRVFHVTQTLQDAAHCGALHACGTAKTSASITAAQAARDAALASAGSLAPSLNAEQITTSFDGAAGTVTVTVHYDFELITPTLGITQPIHLSRRVTLKLAPLPEE